MPDLYEIYGLGHGNTHNSVHLHAAAGAFMHHLVEAWEVSPCALSDADANSFSPILEVKANTGRRAMGASP